MGNLFGVLALLGLFGQSNTNREIKKENYMIRAFNSFQIVTLCAAMPFIIQWLRTAEFSGASAAFWLSTVVYLVLFTWQCIAMYDFCGD